MFLVFETSWIRLMTYCHFRPFGSGVPVLGKIEGSNASTSIVL